MHNPQLAQNQTIHTRDDFLPLVVLASRNFGPPVFVFGVKRESNMIIALRMDFKTLALNIHSRSVRRGKQERFVLKGRKVAVRKTWI